MFVLTSTNKINHHERRRVAPVIILELTINCVRDVTFGRLINFRAERHSPLLIFPPSRRGVSPKNNFCNATTTRINSYYYYLFFYAYTFPRQISHLIRTRTRYRLRYQLIYIYTCMYLNTAFDRPVPSKSLNCFHRLGITECMFAIV